MAATEKPVMVIGIDDSEYAIAALEWTLDHFFSSTTNPPPFNFNLILLHAKPIPEVFVDVAGPGMVVGSAPGLYQVLDQHLKKKAGRIMEKAKQICAAKSVCDVEFVVEEGDARYVLCDAANKHRASMLVVGSHGYGAIKSTKVAPNTCGSFLSTKVAPNTCGSIDKLLSRSPIRLLLQLALGKPLTPDQDVDIQCFVEDY